MYLHVTLRNLDDLELRIANEVLNLARDEARKW